MNNCMGRLNNACHNRFTMHKHSLCTPANKLSPSARAANKNWAKATEQSAQRAL